MEAYLATRNWELAQALAKRLASDDPADPQWAISLAFATRRVESIEAAKEILLEAAARHPNEPTIHYNLSCYECQLGNLDAAKVRVKRAIELQPKCAAMASGRSRFGAAVADDRDS